MSSKPRKAPRATGPGCKCQPHWPRRPRSLVTRFGPRSVARGGATMVETAIVLNLVLLALLAVLDYGKLMMTTQLLNNAAREGARQAVTNTNTLTTSQIQTTVQNYLAGQGLSAMNIQVFQCDPTTGNNLGSWNNTPAGGSIAVQITGNYLPLLPWISLIPSPLAMTATAMMSCEAN